MTATYTVGFQKYLEIRPESTWNVYAGSGSVIVPYTEYSMKTIVTQTQGKPFTGQYDQVHNRRKFGDVTGNLSCPLWGQQIGGQSIGEYLIQWAVDRTNTIFLDSYSIDINDPSTAGKRHTGVRVDGFTLSGDAASGDINLTMQLKGAYEALGVTVPSLTGTEPKPVNFLFPDLTFELASVSTGESASSSGYTVPLRSFELTVKNNLTAYHTNSYWPTIISAGQREIDFKFSVFKSAATYDAFALTNSVTEMQAFLKLKCPHLGTGTGTYSIIEFAFDRISFNSTQDQIALNELVTQELDWVALKPSTSDSAMSVIYGTM